MGHLVISIGREFGSGGKELSVKLAEKLGVKCYDKELLTLSSKDSGLCEEAFAAHDERPTGSFLYNLVMDTYAVSGYHYSTSSFNDMPLNQKVFLAQFDTIKKLAQTEPCVIIGRCADYALEDDPLCCSIFVHAPLSFRIQRVKKDLDIKDEKKLADYIQKADKKRANYYNHFTNKKWGDARSYELTINSSILSMDQTVDAIIAYLRVRNPQHIAALEERKAKMSANE